MRLISPIFFIALGLFGVYTIEFGVVGILPVLTSRFGVSIAQAGALVGLFALIVAACGPVMVLFLSNYNRKKMLVFCLIVFALSSVLSAYSTSYAVLTWSRILPALFHPVYFSLAFVAAASLYEKEHATQAAAKAFVGTSMGMVLGVPITTWIAARFSYEAAFLFCTAVNLVAALGIILMLPEQAVSAKPSYGKQLAILKKVPLWLNIIASMLIFAAMFSVYSYSSEYLGRETGLKAEVISILLVVFGIGGVAGNLLAGRMIASNMVRTTFLHPIVLAIAYLVLKLFGSATLAPMIVIMLFWGGAHTSGLIVTQIWLTSEAPEAPEFATGIYISFINLGVTLGSLAGGWFITNMGMAGSIFCGWLFAVCALLVITVRVLFFGRRGELAKTQLAA
ncbi:MFS transporter [Chromobacterium sp. ASV23]|uniref:MFS transporter n=1 Tax=Chromobacterium sp. ASV23 TaxID=2795110 RepID=UPI0018EB9B28|nr:MFS transporter [Chromobacterium sp. ASV23]